MEESSKWEFLYLFQKNHIFKSACAYDLAINMMNTEE